MAIQSYNNLYLPNLSENLGVMFEHAVDIGINPTIFWNTFVNSNVAKQIEEFGELKIAVKAGESGKLFGTVTTKKLAEELKAESGIEVDRKNMTLDAPINHIGEYKLLIKLTSKVKTELRVVIVASEVLKDRIEEINSQDRISLTDRNELA